MNEDFRIVLEIDESDSGTTNIPLKEERLFLKKFHGYNSICIQCHDNPDRQKAK